MSEDVKELWGRCMAQLKLVLERKEKAKEFSTYFSPIEAIALEGSCLTVRVPSAFYYEFLEENYLTELSEVLRKELGPRASLKYEVVMAPPRDFSKQPPAAGFTFDSAQGVSNPPPPPQTHKAKPPIIDSNLKAYLSFENFVEGNNNQTALNAARKLAAFNPADLRIYSTLMLYGGTGLGKTHLLHAIGLEVKRNFPSKTVIYVSATDFLTQYQHAAQTRKVQNFIAFYQQVDLLLLDDVHMLSDMDGTQKIFQNLFDKLMEQEKRIVLSINCKPQDLTGFRDEVLTRLRWGLMIEMLIPDYDTRLEILRRKAARDGSYNIPDEIFEYIAHSINFSVRELEGALNSLLARSLVKDKPPISLAMVKELVQNIVPLNEQTPCTVESIINTVASYYQIDREVICSKQRNRPVVEARHMVCYLARKLAGATCQNIGNALGGITHATVIYSCSSIENLLTTDTRLQNDYKELCDRLS